MRHYRIILLLLFLILASIGLSVYGIEDADTETLTPHRGTITQTVEETGVVVFDNNYPVTSIVTARVLTADFQEGDTVSRGQVLYTLDSTEIKNQISQTNLSLEKANEAHRQSVNAAGDLRVKSFAGGVVTNVYVHVGDYVTTGGKIADVVDSETLLLQVLFLPSDIDNIFPGSPAEVIMDADDSRTMGTVVNIHESTQVLEGRRVGIMVEIEIANPGALRQGDTAYAKIGELISTSSGAMRNKTEQSIFATQSGQVLELNISEGARVNIGDNVMVIRNDALQNAVNNAALSIRDIQNTLDQLERRLSDFEVTAPADGVIITKSVREADIATAGAPLATLADTGRLYIDVDVDELFINDINVGQHAVASVQGNPDLTYTGQVLRISDSGTARGGVTYFTVKISLDDHDQLMEAMNMNVVITVAANNYALLIPAHAISGNTVRVLVRGDVVEREVKVGIRGSQFVEIIEGLTEQDQIVPG